LEIESDIHFETIFLAKTTLILKRMEYLIDKCMKKAWLRIKRIVIGQIFLNPDINNDSTFVPSKKDGTFVVGVHIEEL
jgi:hypothetical protein